MSRVVELDVLRLDELSERLSPVDRQKREEREEKRKHRPHDPEKTHRARDGTFPAFGRYRGEPPVSRGERNVAGCGKGIEDLRSSVEDESAIVPYGGLDAVGRGFETRLAKQGRDVRDDDGDSPERIAREDGASRDEPESTLTQFVRTTHRRTFRFDRAPDVLADGGAFIVDEVIERPFQRRLVPGLGIDENPSRTRKDLKCAKTLPARVEVLGVPEEVIPEIFDVSSRMRAYERVEPVDGGELAVEEDAEGDSVRREFR